MPTGSTSTSLSITNPLVLYRALIATYKIKPDPAQHRLALQLQKLYFRLKDYSPELEYRHRLDQISRSVPSTRHVPQQRPPLAPSLLSTLFSSTSGRSTLSLTRAIPIHDSALTIDSPQGMLLYGEVGRGKSMLLDLLYSSLPSRKKRRWHFNTFMLDIFRRLEQSRIERMSVPLEHEHVILTLAKDTVATSSILFLDEFQMPDRAASKLLNGFMTSFFHLGGVLVASSNRMPDELAKASGIEFQPKGQEGRMFKWGERKVSEGEKGAQGDFGMFLEVLKARCEVWEMEGERDWRREDGEAVADEEDDLIDQDLISEGEIPAALASSATVEPVASEQLSSDSPPHYHLNLPGSSSSTFNSELQSLNPSTIWRPATLHIYSRPLNLPTTSNGVAFCSFSQVCATNLGPADYTSLCSAFHTLILTDVPVLSLLLKNEARRFITLLDALYEARCRLLVHAAAPPDKLFFPETRTRSVNGLGIQGDSIDSEAYSEMYQDATSPFRPNTSSYTSATDTSAAPTLSPQSQVRSVLADEDADFGPTYGNGRSHGASSNDLLHQEERQQAQAGIGPDFTNLSGLTGEDERFAYKRARSRLWEMCGRRWWNARSGHPALWHQPIDSAGRFWEKTRGSITAAAGSVPLAEATSERNPDSTHDGQNRKLDEQVREFGLKQGLFRHGASPYRVSEEPPPKFAWHHAWGLGEWGKKGSGRARELREKGRRGGEEVKEGVQEAEGKS